MPEGRKISPAVALIPFALGIGILAIATLAKAAPPTPPPGRANLYGTVTDAVTGQPLGGVLVSLDGIQLQTDGQGKYLFDDLEPGGYVVQFAKEGYQTQVF